MRLHRTGNGFLEAGLLYCDGIAANPEGRGGIFAGGIRRRIEDRATINVCHCDLGICNDGTGIVSYHAHDAAGILLRPNRQRQDEA